MGATSDKIKGKAKQVEGRLTGDKLREAQGAAQKTKGDVEGAASRAGRDIKRGARKVKRNIKSAMRR
jgi:uncharacterized protein YjbJ (UPF0337 family)